MTVENFYSNFSECVENLISKIQLFRLLFGLLFVKILSLLLINISPSIQEHPQIVIQEPFLIAGLTR